MPIDIKSIEIQNFKSFGDYSTKIDLEDLGPVLIIGDCEDGGKGRIKASKSNGAGKSSLISAIVWCLWGRTNEKARPGDSVINWSVGKNCLVSIETKDGYTITRTRKFKGKNDLTLFKDGEDQTLSTNKAAQEDINKIFGLDYNIFASSVFFEQRAKPILEMKPKQRQTVIEKMLQLNKLHYRADVSKELLKSKENEQHELIQELNLFKRDIKRLEEELVENENHKAEYESTRMDRMLDIDKKILEHEKKIKEIEVPNIDEITEKWELISMIQSKAKDLYNKKNTVSLEVDKHSSRMAALHDQHTDMSVKVRKSADLDFDNIKYLWERYNEKIETISKIKEKVNEFRLEYKNLDFQIKEKNKEVEEWKEKANTTCPTCKQSITAGHTEHISRPVMDKLSSIIKKRNVLEKQIEEAENQIKDSQKAAEAEKPDVHLEVAESLKDEISYASKRLAEINNNIKETRKKLEAKESELAKINDLISQVDESIKKNTPEISLEKAQSIISEIDNLKSACGELNNDRDRIKNEDNPYLKSCDRVSDTLKVRRKKAEELEKKVQKKDVMIKHFSFIKKAYTNKGKIKSFILNGMIPIINKRLRYYLEQFEFDIVDLEFNNLLELESSKWDYTACSGGERQCLDLALMFALNDMNSIQHGRQSNIMVLDEVDGRLDPTYVDRLASVIVDDIGKKSSTKPSTILVVSHKNDMFDAFPTKIIVKKRDGFSYVSIEK